MSNASIKLEARGEFPFTFYIEKAVADEVDKELVLEGVASTTNIDHDNERMSKEALQAMVNIINEKTVPLRVEHSKSENAVIGSVFKAWLDERNQMHIRASLDKAHPVSPLLHHAMKSEGKKMGFSVGGLVKRAVREFSEAAGKLVKTFYDVELKEVSVTPRPANYDAWAISKSIAKNEGEAETMRGAFYDEFLFENPQLDYLKVFAKSIPDEAWQRVELSKVNKDTNMTEETTMEDTTKAGETTEETADTTKAVSRADFNVLTKAVATLAKAFTLFAEKGGKKVAKGEEALDQRQPDKKKPEDESPAAKAMDTDAKDQEKPDKKKPADESPAAKAREGQEDPGEEAQGSDTGGTREKAADEGSEYSLETVTRATKSIESLVKAMEETTEEATKTGEETTEDTTKTGAENTEEDTTKTGAETEDETTKGMHPLDRFVMSVTKAIEKMAETMQKERGMNLIGFKKHMVDLIRNDSVMQGEIQKMIKIPGAKKSVSFGVPYMTTKDGRRYGLVAEKVGETTVEKTRTSENKSFKDVYKKDFSSIRENGDE